MQFDGYQTFCLYAGILLPGGKLKLNFEIYHIMHYMINSTMYYKVTNESETHNGFVYHDGLNILDKPFQEHGSCVQGGLYFTTIEHIPEFYSYGLFIREVSFPEDDPYFR